MNENYYMINMQKLLHIVKELHIRGFEKLRVIPSMSPSGLSWRCSFIVDSSSKFKPVISSSWIQDVFNVGEKNECSIEELTDMFVKKHIGFLQKCKGDNKEYVEWFRSMLQNLKEGELPYAFAEYFSPTDYWQTSEGRKIVTLTDEKRFYTDY